MFIYESAFTTLTVNILRFLYRFWSFVYKHSPFPKRARARNTRRREVRESARYLHTFFFIIFLFFSSLITQCKNRLSYFRLSTTRSNDTASYRSTKNSRNPYYLVSTVFIVLYLVFFFFSFSGREEALHLQHKIADRLKLSTPSPCLLFFFLFFALPLSLRL